MPLRRRFKSLPLSKITPERIAAYQQARIDDGVTGRTINMEVQVLGRMLKKAKLWALVADDIKLYPEASHIGRALKPEEKRRLVRDGGSASRLDGRPLRGCTGRFDNLPQRRAAPPAVEQRRSVQEGAAGRSQQERVGQADDSAQRRRDASVGSV